jgi:hypothetical protein
VFNKEFEFVFFKSFNLFFKINCFIFLDVLIY